MPATLRGLFRNKLLKRGFGTHFGAVSESDTFFAQTDAHSVYILTLYENPRRFLPAGPILDGTGMVLDVQFSFMSWTAL